MTKIDNLINRNSFLKVVGSVKIAIPQRPECFGVKIRNSHENGGFLFQLYYHELAIYFIISRYR